jgi:hemerythrin-like domain-containing protein
MVMAHTGFRREFGLMPQMVQGVSEGDRKRAEIVADHIAFIWTLLHNHHHSEDLVIWPRLLERCPDEILPLVHGMEKHHERIAALGAELTKGVATWSPDAEVTHRDAVLRTLEQLLPILREHLGAEEEYVLPLIEKHITSDEWNSMASANAGSLPQDRMPLIFGLFMYEGAPSAIQDAISSLPEKMRPVIAQDAPRIYGDYAELVYGTRTPRHGSTLQTSA